MKMTLKILTVTTLAAAIVASQAYAADPVLQQKLMDENATYFQKMGNHGSSGSMAGNPNYDFVAFPQQRNAERDAAYWSKVGSKADSTSGNSMMGVSQYPFPGSVSGNGGYVYAPNIKR